MVQMNGTYYVGATNDSSTPNEGFDAIDAVCGVVLFLSWIGVFLRYGILLPSFVFRARLIAGQTGRRRFWRLPQWRCGLFPFGSCRMVLAPRSHR